MRVLNTEFLIDNAGYPLSLEQIYQAFKERLMAEVVAEIAQVHCAPDGRQMSVGVNRLPLVDKEQK